MNNGAQKQAYEKARLRLGLCRRCGKKRGKSKVHCDRCLDLIGKRQRRVTGYRRWRKGGNGRPPLERKSA